MATDGAEIKPFCGNCDWSEFGPVEDKGLPRIKRTDWCGAHPALNVVLMEAEE
jgi:hypothetical protein